MIMNLTGVSTGSPTPSGYTVTVSLTNPLSPELFISCRIVNLTSSNEPWIDINEEAEIGSIDSATGSTTVLTDPSCFGIAAVWYGNWGPGGGTITCTGGVTYSGGESEWSKFEVEGDGTITIDGADYDD